MFTMQGCLNKARPSHGGRCLSRFNLCMRQKYHHGSAKELQKERLKKDQPYDIVPKWQLLMR